MWTDRSAHEVTLNESGIKRLRIIQQDLRIRFSKEEKKGEKNAVAGYMAGMKSMKSSCEKGEVIADL